MSLAPTLTLPTDNGDGTATTTVGITNGLDAVVYVMQPGGNPAWTGVANRIGDGTLVLPTGGGYFFAYALTADGFSPVTSLFAVTTSSVAVETALCLAVQADLQAIVASLPGLVTGNIKFFKVVDKTVLTNLELPAIVVAPFGQETTIDGTNVEDDWGKPVSVMYFDRNSKVDTTNINTPLLCRERIEKRYRNKPLAGVAQTLVCTIEPGQLFDYSSIALGLDLLMSGMTLRFRTRETRTP